MLLGAAGHSHLSRRQDRESKLRGWVKGAAQKQQFRPCPDFSHGFCRGRPHAERPEHALVTAEFCPSSGRLCTSCPTDEAKSGTRRLRCLSLDGWVGGWGRGTLQRPPPPLQQPSGDDRAQKACKARSSALALGRLTVPLQIPSPTIPRGCPRTSANGPRLSGKPLSGRVLGRRAGVGTAWTARRPRNRVCARSRLFGSRFVAHRDCFSRVSNMLPARKRDQKLLERRLLGLFTPWAVRSSLARPRPPQKRRSRGTNLGRKLEVLRSWVGSTAPLRKPSRTAAEKERSTRRSWRQALPACLSQQSPIKMLPVCGEPAAQRLPRLCATASSAGPLCPQGRGDHRQLVDQATGSRARGPFNRGLPLGDPLPPLFRGGRVPSAAPART